MGGQYVMNNLLSLSPPHFLPFSLSSLLPLLPLPPSLILPFPLISLFPSFSSLLLLSLPCTCTLPPGLFHIYHTMIVLEQECL